MGFNNPAMPWRELEQTLSGRRPDGRAPGSPSWNAGGDGPAWSRKRQPFEAPADLTDQLQRQRPPTPYAELHCQSNFSFLSGASHPEQLAEEAARLGLEALALTDQNGFYGVVRFAEAAKAVGLPTVFGAEITLGISGPYEPGQADPQGQHLVVLARELGELVDHHRAGRHVDADGQRLRGEDDSDQALGEASLDDLLERRHHPRVVRGDARLELGQELAIPQDDAARLPTEPTTVQVLAADPGSAPQSGHWLGATTGAHALLPSAALGSRSGGRVAVDPADSSGRRPTQPVVLGDVQLQGPVPPELGQRVGQRVWVRFEHGHAPLRGGPSHRLVERD